MTGLLFLAASAAMLTAGAELFAEHAGPAARRLGVSALAVGLLLAGAEPEELVTAVIASVRHHPGIAAGDAFGANVTMLTLVLGLAALARPLPMGRRVRRYALASAAATAVATVLIVGGSLSRVEGAVLVAAYALGVAAVWRAEREPPVIGEMAELEEEAVGGRSAARMAVLLVLAGVALMAAGGRVAVAGAERVIDAFNLSDSAVGLTLVALATTAELLAIAWASLRRGVPELAVAAVVGSAAYNATVTLGGAALARPLAVHGVGGAAVLAAALPVAVIALSARRHRLGRLAGVGLLAVYGAYVVVVLA